jgi:shikimate kinase
VATLWLVGMMGAGKSTVGPAVARRLARSFVDLDDVIVAEAGRVIPEIFAAEGEPGFRRREAAALRRLAGAEAVVACGGGIVVDPENVALLRASGMVAWLEAPAEVLAQRVRVAAGRPMLAAEGVGGLKGILASRAEAYAAAAHCRVDTVGRDPEEIAEQVVARWNEFG